METVGPVVGTPPGSYRLRRRQVTTVLDIDQYEEVKLQAAAHSTTIAEFVRSILTGTRHRVSTILDPEQYDRLEKIAASHNVSMGSYLRAILVDVLEEETSKGSPTQEVKNDVQSP